MNAEFLEKRSYLAFGQFEAIWATNGRLALSPGLSQPAVQQMVVSHSGAIYAAGTEFVTRITAAGALDTSFGVDGFAAIPPATIAQEAIDSQGNLLVLIRPFDGGSQLINFDNRGNRISSFGTNGLKSIGNSTFSARSLSLQSDGKILVAGERSTGGRGTRTAVYRFTRNGASDSTFGTAGVAEFQFAESSQARPTRYDRPLTVRALSGGKIALSVFHVAFKPDAEDANNQYIAGVWGNGIVSSIRLTSNGSLDTSFSGDGVASKALTDSRTLATFARATFPETELRLRAASLILPDGTTIASAYNGSAIVTQFTATGTTAWTTDLGVGFPLDEPQAIAALPDGRYVLMGDSENVYGSPSPTLAPISAGGVPSNPVFAGRQNLDIEQRARAIVVSGDGKLLVGGGSGSLAVVHKFQIGKKTDPRPDEFPGAQNNDIAFFAGDLYVAYYDTNTTTLKVAYRAASGLWNAPVTVDSTPFSGQYISIETDRSGQPRVAYFEGTSGDLKFASSDDFGRTWKVERVDTRGSTGLNPSLRMGPKDIPYIAFYRRTSRDLIFAARKKPGRWTFDIVDSAGDVGRSASLYYNDGQPLAIAYADTTNAAVKAAFYEPGVGWKAERVVQTSGGADYISLAMTSSEPFITFYDAGPANLRAARLRSSDGTGWGDTPTIASAGATGLFTNAVLGSFDGFRWVFAYDRTRNRVQLLGQITNGTNAIARNTFTAAEGGGRFLSAVTTTDFTIPGSFIAYYSDDIAGLKVRQCVSPPNDDLSE